MRVQVYFNLHRKRLSVRAHEGPNKGRVIFHTDAIYLRNVKFIVRQGGRNRVLREQKKNVHAFVEGDHPFDAAMMMGVMLFPSACDHECETAVTYNPYKYSTFVEVESQQPIHSAKQVYIDGRCVWADKGESC